MLNKLEVITTADGSKTCLHPEHDASYRSLHGAITEVRHVFIEHALKPAVERLHLIDHTTEMGSDKDGVTHRGHARPKNLDNPILVLEFGFGLGTSFGETYLFARQNNLFIRYLSIERDPVPPQYAQHPDPVAQRAIASLLSQLQEGKEEARFTSCPIDVTVIKADFIQLDRPFLADAIYFDPFGPAENAESWTPEIFRIAAAHLAPWGKLATYSVASNVRRAMESVGLFVQKVPGPPHKRHISVASFPENVAP